MSSIDPRKPSWHWKEPKRPNEASDTSEEEEDIYYRTSKPYEVKLRLGDIEYGQDVNYYQEEDDKIDQLSYLQNKQMHSDRSLYRWDKKGRIIKDIEKDKIQKRKQYRKERFKKKKLQKKKETKDNFEDFVELEAAQYNLPVILGKRNRKEDIQAILKESKRVKLDDINSDGTNESDYEDGFPISHEILLQAHEKAITDIDINPSGSRMVSSGLDYSVKFWDFKTMDSNCFPFRSFQPIESHPVRSAKFSLNGKHTLICAGGIQPKIFSTAGKLHYECVKGDIYMSDMANTHGHVKTVTECVWHPFKHNFFMSSSEDGTIRQWDLQGRLVGIDRNLGHYSFHKARGQNFQRIKVDCCNFSNNGNLGVAGCGDGSIQIWDLLKGNSVQPNLVMYNAHGRQGDITCVKFFNDNQRLLSRAQDNTMKLWDIRNFSTPVKVWENLMNINYKTQIELSPDQNWILTGTSSIKNQSKGTLRFISSQTFDTQEQIEMCDGSVISIKWDSNLNQIFVGSSDSLIHVYYSPENSSNGILDCLKRAPREQRHVDMHLPKPIITPFTLPQFKGDYFNKARKSERARLNPVASRKPAEPISQISRVGSAGGPNSLTVHILSSINALARPEQDPRDLLMSYAPKSNEEADLIESAYKTTQPKRIFDTSEETVEAREFLARVNMPFCKSCGSKVCTCKQRRLGNDAVFKQFQIQMETLRGTKIDQKIANIKETLHKLGSSLKQDGSLFSHIDSASSEATEQSLDQFLQSKQDSKRLGVFRSPSQLPPMHDCSYDFSDDEQSGLKNSHSMGNLQKYSPYSENQQAWDLPTLLDYEKEKVIQLEDRLSRKDQLLSDMTKLQNELCSNLDDAHRQINSLKMQNERESQDVRQQVNYLQKENSDKSYLIQQLKDKIDELQEKNRILQRTSSEVQQTQRDLLETHHMLQGVEKEKWQYAEQIQQLESQLDQQDMDISRLKAELDERDYKIRRSVHESEKIPQLEAKIKGLQMEIQDKDYQIQQLSQSHQNQLSDRETGLRNLQQELQMAKQQILDKDYIVKNLNFEVESLNAQIADKNNKITQINEKKENDLNQTTSKYYETEKSMQRMREQYEREIIDYQQTIEDLRAELQSRPTHKQLKEVESRLAEHERIGRSRSSPMLNSHLSREKMRTDKELHNIQEGELPSYPVLRHLVTDLMHELRIRHTADILSAVRSLRINKDSNKLVENLQKLMLDCTPVDEVKEMPSCKQVWKWIKRIALEYWNLRQSDNYDVLMHIKKILNVSKVQEIPRRVQWLNQDVEDYGEFFDKLKKYFGIPNAGFRELEKTIMSHYQQFDKQ